MPLSITRKTLVVTIVCLAAYVFFLLHEPARGTHSWYAWMFARIFLETGEFTIMGRSPLYTVYAAVFLPLGYPVGPALARFIEGLFIFGGVYFLLKPYIGRALAVFGTAVWLPGIMEQEGIVLGLAIGCFCWAFALRHGSPTRFRLALSYALLITAVMFRINFIVLPLAVAFYDMAFGVYRAGFRLSLKRLVPKPADWPLALCICLWVVFSSFQSDHKWNNGYSGDIQWLGAQDRSLGIAAQLGAFAHWVIVNRYDGDFDNHDIYLIAENDLKDLRSLPDVFKYPEILKGHLIRNIQIINVVQERTDIGRALVDAAKWIGNHKFAYPVFYSLLGFGLFAFYRRLPSPLEKRQYLEILGATAVLFAPLIMVWPVSRYYYFIAPVFILGAAGLGRLLADRLMPTDAAVPHGTRCTARAALLALPVLVFSSGTSTAIATFKSAVEAPPWQRPYLVHETMGGHLKEVREILKDCRGMMMTNDYRVLAAFSDIPFDRLFTIFEIPPFGSYGDSVYDGLRPDRINCVYISEREVQPGTKSMTSKWSRNKDYLVPYVAYLKSKGAKTYDFDFGGLEGKVHITKLD